MRKISNNGEYPDGDKFSRELRAQPRKSGIHRHKSASHHGSFADEDDGERHHAHRSEPAKNVMRVQLRRIQQLF